MMLFKLMRYSVPIHVSFEYSREKDPQTHSTRLLKTVVEKDTQPKPLSFRDTNVSFLSFKDVFFSIHKKGKENCAKVYFFILRKIYLHTF